MKKSLCAFMMGILLLPSFAFGKNNHGIYFCTKDVDGLTSIAQPNENNKGFEDLAAYTGLDNEMHTFARHCFMVFAKKIEENEKILKLKTINTYGYGSSGDNSYGKEGLAAPERDVKNRPVSCVLILDEADLKDGEKIHYKWADVVEIMDNEVVNPISNKQINYNLIGHNCCTVAYKAVIGIGGHIENIDPTSFNMYGLERKPE